jgi:hypothetical protein
MVVVVFSSVMPTVLGISAVRHVGTFHRTVKRIVSFVVEWSLGLVKLPGGVIGDGAIAVVLRRSRCGHQSHQ